MSISKLKKKSQRKKMQEMLKVLPHFATRPGCYFFLPVLLMAWSFYTFGYGAILPPLYKTNVSFRQCFNFLKGRCSLTEKKKTIPKFLFNSTILAGPVKKHYDASVQYSFDLVRSGLVGVLENEIKRIKLRPPT